VGAVVPESLPLLSQLVARKLVTQTDHASEASAASRGDDRIDRALQ